PCVSLFTRSKANSAFVDENYTEALNLYNKALEESPSDAEVYVKRSHAHFRLGNWQATFDDLKAALEHGHQSAKAYLRMGISAFHLGKFEDSKDALEKGRALDSTEAQFSEWLDKCGVQLKAAEEAKQRTAPVPPAPAQSQIRYEWYQTESHVTITILLKNQKPENVEASFTRETANFFWCLQIRFKAKLPSGDDYELSLEVAHPIVAEQTTYKCYSSKVEIRAKKEEGIRWTTLELDHSLPAGPCQRMTSVAETEASKATVAARSKDWDRIVKETGDDKEEGEAALNALFQKIYADGSDEVRRAMNKSFVESGGTVLSTNWNEIKAKKTPIKPPDGMEYRKWQE
ncbi:unnamed protein product, partial [Ixodes hexagonus]